MGGSNETPKKEQEPSIDDILLDMKMAAKKFEMDAKRAEKEKAKQYQLAQNAIKKNNEEGAKLFLQNVMMKDREMKSMQRMAQKMDALQMQIKGNTSNTVMMAQINKMSPLLQQQANAIPTEQLYKDMTRFESAMDEIMVQGNVMTDLLGNHMGTNVQQNSDVDNMLNQLKMDNLNSIQNNLNGDNNQLFKDLKPLDGTQVNQQVQK